MQIRTIQAAALSVAFSLILSFSEVPLIRAETADNQNQQIDEMVRAQFHKAGTPAAAIAVIRGDEVEYHTYSDRKTVDEHTLFQLGSVSKAFTGLGILLLEDEGQLSLSDPVSRYIPWFSVRFNGGELDPEVLTVAHLLYHTSGFTNDESRYPRATGMMTLEENIRQISGSELVSYPSARYAYANTNYHLLGYIIETVAGQSYQDFMHDRIFAPLGLHHTYATPDYVNDGESMVPGSRLSFFRARPYETLITPGNVPAGYIISNAADMGRWMQLQMGTLEVSAQYSRIIGKSHLPNPDSTVRDQLQYAGGWYVDGKTGRIYHSGGTPGFSAHAAYRQGADMAVCVLTNMNASVNTDMVAGNILDILEGRQPEKYRSDIWRIFDTIFALITFAGIAGSAVGLVTLVRVRRQILEGQRHRVHRGWGVLMWLLLPSLLLLLFAGSVMFLLPSFFGADWPSMLVWGPLSVPAGGGALLLSAVILLAGSWASASTVCTDTGDSFNNSKNNG